MLRASHSREVEVPTRLLKFHALEIVFGIDSMAEAAHSALRLGGQRPLLVTDPGLIEAGWVDELVDHLRDQGVQAQVWSALTLNPKDHARSPPGTSSTGPAAVMC